MQAAGDFEAMPKKEPPPRARAREAPAQPGRDQRPRPPPEAVFVTTPTKSTSPSPRPTARPAVVAVVDTNCDPDIITYVIPAMTTRSAPGASCAGGRRRRDGRPLHRLAPRRRPGRGTRRREGRPGRSARAAAHRPACGEAPAAAEQPAAAVETAQAAVPDTVPAEVGAPAGADLATDAAAPVAVAAEREHGVIHRKGTSKRSARRPASGCSTPNARSTRTGATRTPPPAGCARRAWRQGQTGRAPASQGAVAVVRQDNVAAIVELRCETDFVAKSAEFVSLADELRCPRGLERRRGTS